jgi:hypothetical protein
MFLRFSDLTLDSLYHVRRSSLNHKFGRNEMTSGIQEISLPKAPAMAHIATARGGGASVKLSVIAGLFALGIAGHASAGCGAPAANPNLPSELRSPSVPSTSRFLSAVYRPGAEGRFLLTGDDGGWPGEAGIVGMWRFLLVAPNGAVVDDGYAQWHSDGTEIQNSGLHAPDTGNFCLGVWQQVGPNKYKLNHFPLAWTGTTGGGGTNLPAAAIQLTETVKLTDNDHFTGTFTLNVYGRTSPNSLNVSPSTPVQTVTGTITATRVTIDSTVPGAE